MKIASSLFLILILSCSIAEGERVQDKKPKILNMDRINTPADEDDPCPSADGQQLIYTSSQNDSLELYLSVRSSPGDPLGPGKLIDELAGEGKCRSAFLLSKDKEGWEYLYFATQYHTDKKQPNFDIYRVGRFSAQRPFQGYSAASPVQVSASEADEAFPWVSTDGREVYFSRKTPAGWQLMHAVGKDPNVFQKAETVPLEPGYHHAVLSRSGLTMILQGPIATGEAPQGLFVCRRMKTSEPWASPKPIVSLNTPEGKIGTCSPALSGDQKYLYFSSDRPGGKGGLDLYVVAVSEVEELKK